MVFIQAKELAFARDTVARLLQSTASLQSAPVSTISNTTELAVVTQSIAALCNPLNRGCDFPSITRRTPENSKVDYNATMPLLSEALSASLGTANHLPNALYSTAMSDFSTHAPHLFSALSFSHGTPAAYTQSDSSLARKLDIYQGTTPSATSIVANSALELAQRTQRFGFASQRKKRIWVVFWLIQSVAFNFNNLHVLSLIQYSYIYARRYRIIYVTYISKLGTAWPIFQSRWIIVFHRHHVWRMISGSLNCFRYHPYIFMELHDITQRPLDLLFQYSGSMQWKYIIQQ